MIKLIEKYYGHVIFFIAIMIVGVIIYGVYLEPYAIRLFQDRIVFGAQSLSLEDIKYLDRMIVLNKIHTGDLAIERIIGFYQTLLTTIIGIAALGSFTGFLYIRNSHKRDICDGIEKEISTESTHKKITMEISKMFNEERESGDLKLQADDIEELAKRIEQVEKLTDILAGQIDEIRQNKETQEKITIPTSIDIEEVEEAINLYQKTN